jgi:hypothetical protein
MHGYGKFLDFTPQSVENVGGFSDMVIHIFLGGARPAKSLLDNPKCQSLNVPRYYPQFMIHHANKAPHIKISPLLQEYKRRMLVFLNMFSVKPSCQ